MIASPRRGSYPAAGPSVLARMFRVTPPAGAAPCADASVAMNPVIAQIAQDAKPRRVSMVTSLDGERFRDGTGMFRMARSQIVSRSMGFGKEPGAGFGEKPGPGLDPRRPVPG